MLSMAPPMAWGVTPSWLLVVSAALGLWLMFAPTMFGSQGMMADSDHLAGPVVFTVAVISMAEVVRAGRFLNVVLGVWIVAAPWLLSGATGSSRWNSVLVGVAVAALSFPRGTIREKYGGWDRYVV
jgi:hypothetical protein